MAKPAAARPDEQVALEVLVKLLESKNETYAAGVEVARLDAVELILKFSPAGDKAREVAMDLLRRAMLGQIPSMGAQLRARAAGIILGLPRGEAATAKEIKGKGGIAKILGDAAKSLETATPEVKS